MEIHVLELPFDNNGKKESLHPVILRSPTHCLLVDCGYPGFLPLLEDAAARTGISLREITGILITHHDVDHMGALHEARETYPHLQVYATAAEAPYIDGSKPSLRLEQALRLQEGMSSEEKLAAEPFIDLLESVKTVPVDLSLPPAGKLPFFRDVIVVPTPGHMPHHISLYLPSSRTLVAADTVVYEEGKLDIANPQFALDLPQALASIEKLATLDCNRIICYHGGVVEGDTRALLQQLLLEYGH